MISTVGEPGVHGAGITGIQGCGVKTPRAAAVAAATCGLDGVIHIPKGGMLAIGMLSAIVAAICPLVCTGCPLGIGLNELGAAPKLHISVAPMHTT